VGRPPDNRHAFDFEAQGGGEAIRDRRPRRIGIAEILTVDEVEGWQVVCITHVVAGLHHMGEVAARIP
jgi:hypothetical protein